MIPKNNIFSPWLDLVIGMEVEVLTEAGPKDNPKLKAPFYCEVDFQGGKFTISLNWASYSAISEVFGVDTESWIGQTIKYEGLKPIKGKMGTVKGHIWTPIIREIDLSKPPF